MEPGAGAALCGTLPPPSLPPAPHSSAACSHWACLR